MSIFDFLNAPVRSLAKGSPWTLLYSSLALFAASRIIKLLNGLRAVSYLPGFRVAFSPVAHPGALLPDTWWNLNFQCPWIFRRTLYNLGETFSVIPFLSGPPILYTSNIDVMRQVLSGDSKASWNKPPTSVRVISKWGTNLVAALDGEVWRRHRRVVGPAFDNTLYQMVWAKTLETFDEMVTTEGWSNKTTVDLPAVQAISTKMTLLVIAKCGFGLPFRWDAPPIGPDGKITVQEALRVLSDSYIVGMMMPTWVQYLPLPGFAKIRRAFQAFTGFMKNEIVSRVEEVRSGSELSETRRDTFTMIVRANEQETGKVKLSDQEVEDLDRQYEYSSV